MRRLVFALCAVPGLSLAQASAPASDVMAYDSSAVGGWVLVVGCVICFGLGFIGGRQR